MQSLRTLSCTLVILLLTAGSSYPRLAAASLIQFDFKLGNLFGAPATTILRFDPQQIGLPVTDTIILDSGTSVDVTSTVYTFTSITLEVGDSIFGSGSEGNITQRPGTSSDIPDLYSFTGRLFESDATPTSQPFTMSVMIAALAGTMLTLDQFGISPLISNAAGFPLDSANATFLIDRGAGGIITGTIVAIADGRLAPEPRVLLLFMAGLVALGLFARTKNRARSATDG